ncbi:uncharacterized protein L203_103240 [Cryptococcus depauperatus CBS 7841]|uniref:Uncharacterized protein n=1 Tax=Cryptococcus depauperatus CBS 7841 TaxID=1295531 RepID=A0A1E3HPG9_9TREE|nr:hypothetical protein L203_06144 [Cryptococcus depauperatus CBS 7841]
MMYTGQPEAVTVSRQTLVPQMAQSHPFHGLTDALSDPWIHCKTFNREYPYVPLGQFQYCDNLQQSDLLSTAAEHIYPASLSCIQTIAARHPLESSRPVNMPDNGIMSLSSVQKSNSFQALTIGGVELIVLQQKIQKSQVLNRAPNDIGAILMSNVNESLRDEKEYCLNLSPTLSQPIAESSQQSTCSSQLGCPVCRCIFAENCLVSEKTNSQEFTFNIHPTNVKVVERLDSASKQLIKDPASKNHHASDRLTPVYAAIDDSRMPSNGNFHPNITNPYGPAPNINVTEYFPMSQSPTEYTRWKGRPHYLQWSQRVPVKRFEEAVRWINEGHLKDRGINRFRIQGIPVDDFGDAVIFEWQGNSLDLIAEYWAKKLTNLGWTRTAYRALRVGLIEAYEVERGGKGVTREVAEDIMKSWCRIGMGYSWAKSRKKDTPIKDR